MLLSALLLFGSASGAFAHGGVLMEEDSCVIRIGFLKAHFTGYQPGASGNEEFCEDIPRVAKSIFVLDYLHDYMREMPIDFRIIEDVNDLGIYAKWTDIIALEDIEGDTIFYQPPAKHANGVLTVDYRFEQAGNYIGIVTAQHPGKDKSYSAVFPFTVGGSGFSYVPVFITLIVLAQAFYWISSGGLKRFRPAAH